MTGLVAVLLAAAPEPLVEVSARIPDAVVDLRYATADNFMKKQVYPTGASCLLLEPAVELLARAAATLRGQGYRLRLYDCYRPHALQYLLWAAMPKRGYVAEPKTGSHHNRGGAVDVSLVKLDGGAVEMPSAYDAFGPAAHQGFSGGTAASRANREVLRAAMKAAGFISNHMEWWHYELPEAVKYPLREEPFVVDGGARLSPGRDSPR